MAGGRIERLDCRGPQRGTGRIVLDDVVGKVKGVVHVDHARADSVGVPVGHSIGRGGQCVLDLVGGQVGKSLQQVSYGP